jgi:hypothetical protein
LGKLKISNINILTDMLKSRHSVKHKFQSFANQFKNMLEGVERPEEINWSLLGFPDPEDQMVRRKSFITFTDLTKFEIVAEKGVSSILKYPKLSSAIRYSAIPEPWGDVLLNYELGVLALIIENEGVRKELQEGKVFDISFPIRSADGRMFNLHQSSWFVFSSDGKPCGRIDYCVIDKDTYDPVVKGEITNISLDDLFYGSGIFDNIIKNIIDILGLTKREIEICYYLLIGYNNEGVAISLTQINHGKKIDTEERITLGTVQKHTSNITQKGKILFPNSSVNDARDVAFLLFRHGIITQEKERMKFLTHRD